MRPAPAPRRLALALATAAGIGAAAVVAFGVATPGAEAEDTGALVAGSVCEAHALKARQAADPHLKIEIPPQFNTPWPSAEACLSHEAALDPNTPGMVQPIPFSHKHHAGTFQIQCDYCHSGTDRSPSAGVPSVELCMGCHAQFPPSYDELSGIQTLKQQWKDQRPIEWLQIHRLPEYVQFRHNRHIQKGFACQTCHGAVETQDKVQVKSDTHWWPWGLPTRTLEMGWCINCHRQNGASTDCATCHY
jgi:hypothetical protein